MLLQVIISAFLIGTTIPCKFDLISNLITDFQLLRPHFIVDNSSHAFVKDLLKNSSRSSKPFSAKVSISPKEQLFVAHDESLIFCCGFGSELVLEQFLNKNSLASDNKWIVMGNTSSLEELMAKLEVQINEEVLFFDCRTLNLFEEYSFNGISYRNETTWC